MSVRVTGKGLKVACFDVVSRRLARIPNKEVGRGEEGTGVARGRIETRRKEEAIKAGMRREPSDEGIWNVRMNCLMCQLKSWDTETKRIMRGRLKKLASGTKGQRNAEHS